MARKKAEPLVGLSKVPDNKLIVQKSRPLTALWQSDLTLAEFKILDTYLARIDSHNPEKRSVALEKGEIEKCLGVKRIRREELADRIVHLGQGIKVPDEHSRTGFRVIWLFEEAECKQDDNGIWQVRLECSKKAMQYFFNIEKLGYLRYKLKSIASLQSRYSYVLFIYLENNRFRESWEIDLNELKEILNCGTEETYKEFKRFNDLILKRCQKELNEKTECKFTYTPIKKGRTVSAIRFNLLSNTPLLTNDEEADPNQITIFSAEQADCETEKQELRLGRVEKFGLGFEDPIFDEFTDAEIEELRELAKNHIDEDERAENKKIFSAVDANNITLASAIRKKVLAMNAYHARTPILHRYNYLKRSLE